MKISDIYKCGNVWAETKVVINNRKTDTIFEGTFYEIPKGLAEHEIDFWAINDLKKFGKFPKKIATEIFVALK